MGNKSSKKKDFMMFTLTKDRYISFNDIEVVTLDGSQRLKVGDLVKNKKCYLVLNTASK